MFLTLEDYKVVIGEQSMKTITQDEESNYVLAEAEAREEISGYLRPRYDCEAIFSAKGTARNRMIVMYAVDIALYHMAASASGRMNRETRKERYDRAIEWLEGVQSGKIIPDLPLATSEGGESATPIHWGSEKRHKNTW